MAKRQSVDGKQPRHENPIPNASRIGNVVMSSVIGGANPGTRDTEWIKMLSDAASRRARHTLTLPADSRALVQADFTAVLSQGA